MATTKDGAAVLIQEVSIGAEAVTLNAELQPRERVDESVVVDYAEAMQRGEVFPPIRIVKGDEPWVVDGWHRVLAARSIGVTKLTARVSTGSFDQALDESLTVNRDHGLRRTHADVQVAIRRALQTARWIKRSDNSIAKHIGCSDKTVSACREAMEATSEIPKLDRLVGEDGKTRQRPTTPKVTPRQTSPSQTSPATPIPLPPTPPAPYELVDARLTELRREQERILAALAELDLTAPKLTPAERRTVRDRLEAVRRRVDASIVQFGGRHTPTPGPERWTDGVAEGRTA